MRPATDFGSDPWRERSGPVADLRPVDRVEVAQLRLDRHGLVPVQVSKAAEATAAGGGRGSRPPHPGAWPPSITVISGSFSRALAAAGVLGRGGRQRDSRKGDPGRCRGGPRPRLPPGHELAVVPDLSAATFARFAEGTRSRRVVWVPDRWLAFLSGPGRKLRPPANRDRRSEECRQAVAAGPSRLRQPRRPGCWTPITALASDICPTMSTSSCSASTDAAPPWRRSNPCSA